MNTFHEVDFPFSVALGASGGPQRRTEIVRLASGREERNTPWADSLRRWDAGAGIASLDDCARLIAFFEARRGPLHGFRFRDPLDHRSGLPSADPAPGDQDIATGDGTTLSFQLVKHYGDGPERWTRTIHKPVTGSVRAAVDGVETGVAINPATGLISFAAPPAAGAQITAGFEFDCPVRFAADQLDISIDAFGAGAAPSIPLTEIRL